MPLSELVSYASRQHSQKGEDFYATKVTGEHGVMGVFDSHGGKEAGSLCAAELVEQLTLLPAAANECGHFAFPEDAVVDTFWAMDHRLGREGIYSGSTASVLLVSQTGNDEPGLACTIAWVGDSTAVAVSMADPCRSPPPLWQTANHTPANAEESKRCVVEWEVRREVQMLREAQREETCGTNLVQLEVGDPLSSDWSDSFVILKEPERESFYARKRAPTAVEVAAAVNASGLNVTEEDKALLVRALGREKRIEAPERRASFALGRESTRSNTKVIARGNADFGPKVLAGGDSGKVSTCVTRSIGDWDGARAMIPQPEISRFAVGPEEHVRVVIASDGVWDFLSPDEAAGLARRASTVNVAACAIADKARARSMQRLNALKDDTTCLVVDLNPSRRAVLPPEPVAGGIGGCCAIA